MKTSNTASYKPAPADVAREQQYQAESDLRTLAEAQKIRKDKTRFARALACAKAMMSAVAGTKAKPADAADSKLPKDAADSEYGA